MVPSAECHPAKGCQREDNVPVRCRSRAHLSAIPTGRLRRRLVREKSATVGVRKPSSRHRDRSCCRKDRWCPQTAQNQRDGENSRRGASSMRAAEKPCCLHTACPKHLPTRLDKDTVWEPSEACDPPAMNPLARRRTRDSNHTVFPVSLHAQRRICRSRGKLDLHTSPAFSRPNRRKGRQGEL